MRTPTALITTIAALAVSTSAEATIEEQPLWRLQVRARTCDLPHAGTDAPVWVQLTNRGTERFWLDKGGDDRTRGHTDSWDVVIGSMATIGDITQIRFGIAGTDAWCFDRVALLVNLNVEAAVAEGRALIYDRSFPPVWLGRGADQSIVATALQLRLNNPLWNLDSPRSLIAAPAARVPRGILESIIEGYIGDQLGRGRPSSVLKWGKRRGRSHVEVSHRTGDPGNQAHVDLDLNLPGRKSRPRAVDVDFDVVIRCQAAPSGGGQQLCLDIINADADIRPFIRGLAKTLSLSFRLVAGKPRLVPRIPDQPGVSCSDVPLCGSPRFEADGTLRLL